MEIARQPIAPAAEPDPTAKEPSSHRTRDTSADDGNTRRVFTRRI
jgi:hypothetical protein